MYSVFIVDDEQIVLDGIRSRIPWSENGLTLAGEAGDGELAFSMIQDVKPDILITDIKMPFMDGLELATLVRKNQPWIKIIILSGHDEFEYAKKAISIGVEDYILKPFTVEEILASLGKVTATLDKEKKQTDHIHVLQEELKNSAIQLKNNFLANLVNGSMDSATCRAKAADFNLEFSSRFYKVVVSNVSDQNGFARAVSSAREFLGATSFTLDNKLVTIIKGNNENEVIESAYSFCDAVEHSVSADMESIVVSAIGKSVEHISEISDSYSDALHVLEMSRIFKKSKTLSSDDVNSSSDGILSLQETDPLVDRLKYAAKNEIDSIVQQYMEMLQDNSDNFSVVASYLLVDVVVTVSKLVEEFGGDIRNLMPEILSHKYIDETVRNKDELISQLRRIFICVLEFRDSKIQGHYGEVILKAKDFIDKNFMSQDTCLSSVADCVCLSPNHFSTIFSQTCGITFIEYLTNVRIEAAKKMLKTTEKKSSDIAYDCGFSDPHYFSFIFKKTTGMTPREYRNS